MEDLKEIKADVKELLQRSAVHNQILSEHKNFSIALQNEQKLINAKIEPIEKHVSLVNSVAKVVTAVLVGFIVQGLIRYFLMK